MWHAVLPSGSAISGRSGNALYDEARRLHVPPSALRETHADEEPLALRAAPDPQSQ